VRRRLFIAVAGLAGAASTIVDATARHLLPAEPYRMELATTAARYGLIHAVALLALALAGQSNRWLGAAGWCFVVGLVLFCGSLDTVALGGTAAAVTFAPWGGTAFIIGWIAVLIAAIEKGPPGA
jgi:uncharacterized membrane protein YgdD (TMEM256/DUF423 family)